MIADRVRGRRVLIRHRDPETLERIESIEKDLYPYCFVRVEDLKEARFKHPVLRHEGGYEGVYGEALVKLTFADPVEVGVLKRDFQTWEANIPFVNRVLADRPEPIPQYQYRKAYLDLEWKTESGEITIIGLWDSYKDQMFSWVYSQDVPAGKHDSLPCVNHPEGKDAISFYPHLLAFNSEREMLTHFVGFVNRMDYDMVIGWYLQGADINQIAGRMKHNGMNPNDLSPMRRHRYDYGDWDQPIPGRICLDLMVGFEKLWVLKNGQLDSRKLDDVAWNALKERKLPLEDGHDTFYSDVATYIDYNRQDVRLMPRLDARLNVSEHFITLAHLTQSEFRSTPHVTKIATQLFLRDPDFEQRIPSRPQFAKENYQGADIQAPEPGLYSHVGIFDIRAMYHSNAALHNISWDSIDDENGVDCGNGVKFSKDRVGLLVRIMDKLTELRNGYKTKMRSDPDNAATWDAMQFATKSLVASLYGICGDAKYGLYHPAVASAITYTSRQTLGRLREYAQEGGYNVIYGHTDSIMVVTPTPEEGQALCASLNDRMAPIVVEFEKWCESFIIKAKNRYAGKVAWADGEYHDPTTYVKGMELIQARMPNAMKRCMRNTLGSILDGDSVGVVDEQLTEVIERALRGGLPPADLYMKGRLRKNLDEYDVLSGPSAGAAWANKHLGKGYEGGDYFLVAINTDGNYIAFDDPAEIQGITQIGYRIMVERFIVKKVEPLYELAGWSLQPVINAMNGVSATEWL